MEYTHEDKAWRQYSRALQGSRRAQHFREKEIETERAIKVVE